MPSRYIPETLTTLIEANDGDCEASAEYKVLLRACVEISSQLNDHDASLLLEHISITANEHEEVAKNGLDPNKVKRLQIKAAQFQTDFWRGIKEMENFQDGAEPARGKENEFPPLQTSERTGSNRNVGPPSPASFQSSSTEPFTSKANGLSQSQQEKRQEGTSRAGSSQADTAQADTAQAAFTRATSSQATSAQAPFTRSNPAQSTSSQTTSTEPFTSTAHNSSQPPQEKQSTCLSRAASSRSAATMPSRLAESGSSQSEVERLQGLTIELQAELLRERKMTTELQAELMKESKENESLRKECERLREKERGAPPPPPGRTRSNRSTGLSTKTPSSTSSAPEPLRFTGNDLSQEAAPKPSKRPATGSMTPAPSKKRPKTATNRDATDQIMAMIKVKPAGSASLVALADHSDELSQTVRAKIEPFARKPYIVDGKWTEGCFVAKAFQVSPIYDRGDTKNKKDGVHTCADCMSRRLPCIFMDPKGNGTEAVMLPLPEEERPEGATPDEVRYYCKE
ncbi:unnamed protein product [Zymoseptoria tritici ST99CH_1E4]|uniref:Uncharacterized protein n=1 Tax=Zymoseptoria tritici ST99CH_1E4 TaxID=1276532 RepID=A0A2H1G3G3_ZYMTR|nr:unnamed protein product [Zymoseptoria tritici ST99CH_1E4]